MTIPLKPIETLSERLLYIRRVKGLSQAELAKLANTSQQAIQQAESGKAKSPRYLVDLALALEIPQGWLTVNLMPEEEAMKIHGFNEQDIERMKKFKSMPQDKQEVIGDLINSNAKD